MARNKHKYHYILYIQENSTNRSNVLALVNVCETIKFIRVCGTAISNRNAKKEIGRWRFI